MLLEFKCSNHRSIKEQVTFSMAAGTDNTHEESLIKFDKFRVLPAAVIYGANGSGKSSFIDALLYMCEMVRLSARNQSTDFIEQYPHKLSDEYDPSEYDIQFVTGGVRYAYGFSVEKDDVGGESVISSEYLYFFPNNRPVKIFERDNAYIIKLGDRYKNNNLDFVIENMVDENRLFLSCAGNYSKVEEIRKAYMFFVTGLKVGRMVDGPGLDLIRFRRWKDAKRGGTIEMLQSLGTDARDVRLAPSDLDVIEETKLPDSPAEREAYLRREGKMELVYDKFAIDMKDESRGIKRLFQVIPRILNALEEGTVLVFDELESSLHECILVELVRLFNDPKKNNGAQLIFSTHNTNLLDSDLFRRDQVWFTELDNEERKTDLYSLVEIKNVRKSENLAKGYISGKYGAIPMLNKNILKERH